LFIFFDFLLPLQLLCLYPRLPLYLVGCRFGLGVPRGFGRPEFLFFFLFSPIFFLFLFGLLCCCFLGCRLRHSFGCLGPRFLISACTAL
jgi:hypothetical protein